MVLNQLQSLVDEFFALAEKYPNLEAQWSRIDPDGRLDVRILGDAMSEDRLLLCINRVMGFPRFEELAAASRQAGPLTTWIAWLKVVQPRLSKHDMAFTLQPRSDEQSKPVPIGRRKRKRRTVEAMPAQSPPQFYTSGRIPNVAAVSAIALQNLLVRLPEACNALDTAVPTDELVKPNNTQAVITEADGPRLTPTEKNIMALIREIGHRMTTGEIVSAMEERRGPTSEGMTKQRLADLVRRGLLTNRSDTTPRGYGLPEWSVHSPNQRTNQG